MPLTILNRQRTVPFDRPAWTAGFEAILTAAKVADREVSLMLVSDPAMRKLNREWRGFDKPTDCLSFPSAEGEGSEFAGEFLGDIVISLETALRQGRERAAADTADDAALRAEVMMLFAHSLLHLLGWDHPDDASAKKMDRKAKKLLEAVTPR